jgi:hypothetical protein
MRADHKLKCSQRRMPAGQGTANVRGRSGAALFMKVRANIILIVFNWRNAFFVN